jgi:IstB-like ATP binding protein
LLVVDEQGELLGADGGAGLILAGTEDQFIGVTVDRLDAHDVAGAAMREVVDILHETPLVNAFLTPEQGRGQFLSGTAQDVYMPAFRGRKRRKGRTASLDASRQGQPCALIAPPIPPERGEDVAAAMIDRLLHHAEVISLKGDNYRLKDRDLGRVPAATVTKQT